MKHKFLQPNALLNELRQIYISNGKLIIAYDFDNTIQNFNLEKIKRP